MYLVNMVSSLLNTHMLLNVLTLCALVYHVACHECYICGVGDNTFSCADFNSSHKEICPNGITSCGLQINGNDVIARTCGEARNLTDCKVANKIKYCYCAANLCNGDTNFGFETDDEDLSEDGSGYDTTTITITSTTDNIPSIDTHSVKPKSNDSNNLRVTVFLFLYFLVFI